jgi:D-tyrosyl-tRNA(Tyr) deacylase
MKALLQRVKGASVSVDGATVAEIGAGILVFLGLDRGDTAAMASRMVEKILNYRLFSDPQGKMNCSVRDISGGVLLVSQFTLAADTHKGLRPSFSSAMAPAEAEPLFTHTVELCRAVHSEVGAGIFAADMQVSLVNDGPVTFLLEIAPA